MQLLHPEQTEPFFAGVKALVERTDATSATDAIVSGFSPVHLAI